VGANHLLELVVGVFNGMDVHAQFGALDGWADAEPVGKPRFAGDDPVR
jgi:hypothetical protein